MQVLLNIPEAYFEDECSPAFAYKERAKIEKEYNLRPMDDVEVVNIGPGADWIVILATISIAWKVFQVPGQIKKRRYFYELLSLDGKHTSLFKGGYAQQKGGAVCCGVDNA